MLWRWGSSFVDFLCGWRRLRREKISVSEIEPLPYKIGRRLHLHLPIFYVSTFGVARSHPPDIRREPSPGEGLGGNRFRTCGQTNTASPEPHNRQSQNQKSTARPPRCTAFGVGFMLQRRYHFLRTLSPVPALKQASGSHGFFKGRALECLFAYFFGIKKVSTQSAEIKFIRNRVVRTH